MISFMNDALSLSNVPRWAVVRTLRPQTVADHSFRVAIIAKKIIDLIPIDAYNEQLRMVDSFRLVWWSLIHDISESVTGDIPSHAKALMGIQGFAPVIMVDIGVNSVERSIVKLADTIEAFTWLSANKTGAHADRVAHAYIYPRMMKLVANSTYCPVDTLSVIVKFICDEIAREDGRDHFERV